MTHRPIAPIEVSGFEPGSTPRARRDERISTVVPFARGRRRVVIDSGIVVESDDPAEIGAVLYTVEVTHEALAADDEEVWAGPSYDEAKRVAKALSEDAGILPIVDKVVA